MLKVPVKISITTDKINSLKESDFPISDNKDSPTVSHQDACNKFSTALSTFFFSVKALPLDVSLHQQIIRPCMHSSSNPQIGPH